MARGLLGAFSYSKSQVNQVYKYITDQKEQHKKRTFLDEYRDILKKFDVPYDEKYIFHAIGWQNIPSLDGLNSWNFSTNILVPLGLIATQMNNLVLIRKFDMGNRQN